MVTEACTQARTQLRILVSKCVPVVCPFYGVVPDKGFFLGVILPFLSFSSRFYAYYFNFVFVKGVAASGG